MAMNYPGFSVERHDDAVIATLKSPPAHTWTPETLLSLKHIVDMAEAQNEVHVLIVTASGDKFFSAGADLNVFKSGDKEVDKANARLMSQRFGEAFEALASFSGVSIAAINGYAMGGGLECALACDFRIAEEHAVLALPEASVGLLPCAGGTQWLAWNVGEVWAKRLVLLGQRVDAATALRIGLIDELADKGGALQRALVMAKQVRRQSPEALRACKRLIQGARSAFPRQLLAMERKEFVGLFDTENPHEGISAFLERREPIWKDR